MAAVSGFQTATTRRMSLENFLDFGPLCTSQKYMECHLRAQENFQQCGPKDRSCSCYYVEVVYKECIKLCPTYHHETFYRLRSLCSDVPSVKFPSKEKSQGEEPASCSFNNTKYMPSSGATETAPTPGGSGNATLTGWNGAASVSIRDNCNLQHQKKIPDIPKGADWAQISRSTSTLYMRFGPVLVASLALTMWLL
ncbi:predicted protein [Scheffersomyces stipitis CBS 6054]|uniref:Uncharacterized protein n=1 Tax=Scheffersomyces stipitis (strain ATCC 58785 / CBS 6054 / NBRC 10063 / NRRL Y-11545) TaxID=322104 RepID=A3GH37_PICST|nr:predicted protein [Scheffersomyces stipitis CBS 6054]EAZ62750.2 predicted protein [Scheffersomyces stipitis CBS 6054]